MKFRLARSGSHFDYDGDAPIDADALILENYAYEYRDALARNDISVVKPDLEQIRPQFGANLTPLDEQLIGRALLQILADNLDQSAQRMRTAVYPFLHGSDVEAPTPPVDVDAEALAAAPTASLTFKAAWEDAMKDNMATKKWSEGRVEHASSTLKLWLRVHGDMALNEIQRHHAVSFRRTVSSLPGRYHRDARWKGMTVDEIIADVDLNDRKAGTQTERISLKTTNRHISQLKMMWLDFVSLDHLANGAPNPFESLHINVQKDILDIREERDQFTPQEIQTLFASPVWTGCRSASRRTQPGTLIIRDWKYWIPLLGAYTGMRREEICALQVRDFEEMDGIWIVNLRQSKLRLKTPGSPRYVPVHDHLIKWGLLADLVEGRPASDWVFPDLTPSAVSKRRGEPFGKWFTPLRKQLGIYRPEVVFHSFRHTVATGLHNAAAHEPFIEEIIGHESKERRSETKRYTKKTLVQNLKKTIDLLDYGLTLQYPH